jgi:nucleoid-associated protein YgaU
MKFPFRMTPFRATDDAGGGAPSEQNPDNTNPDVTQPETPPAETTPPAQQTPPDNRSQFIPRERFDDVNGKYRTLQETHNTLSTSYQTALTERDTAKAEAETAKTRATQLEAALTEMLKVRVDALPEDKRDLIPDGLSVDQKLVWLDKATAKGIFTAPQQTQQPIGSPTNPAPGAQTLNLDIMSPLAKMAAAYGAKH